MTSESVKKFVTEYYSTLCASPSEIGSFYAPNAEMSYGWENGEMKKITDGFEHAIYAMHKTQKHAMKRQIGLNLSADATSASAENTEVRGEWEPIVTKVFIDSLQDSNHGFLSIYSIIGRQLLGENEVFRFSQTFVVFDGRIARDICILLDEEVKYTEDIYERHKINRFSKNRKKAMAIEIVGGASKKPLTRLYNDFRSYGEITAIEIVEEGKHYIIEYIGQDQVDKALGDFKRHEESGYRVMPRFKVMSRPFLPRSQPDYR